MSKRKLLLADDSVTIQKVVDLTFQDEGFEVISVGDGNSAMDKLRENQPDLVLADVNMPGLNGYEICDKIKNSDDFGDIPVVLLVGSFEPFDEEEAERVGADTHLTKPFQSISQLVNVVFGLVGPGNPESERAMSAAQSAENGTFDLPSNPPDFGSLEADDEMIQTDQIGSVPVDEVSRFETQAPVESPEGTVDNVASFETFNTVEEASFTDFEKPADNDPAVFENQEMVSDEDSSDSQDDFREFSIVEPTESYGVTTGNLDEESGSEDETEEDPSEESESSDENQHFDGFDSQSFDAPETAELPAPGEDLFSLDEVNLLEVPVADGDDLDTPAEDESSFSEEETFMDDEPAESTDEPLDEHVEASEEKTDDTYFEEPTEDTYEEAAEEETPYFEADSGESTAYFEEETTADEEAAVEEDFTARGETTLEEESNAEEGYTTEEEFTAAGETTTEEEITAPAEFDTESEADIHGDTSYIESSDEESEHVDDAADSGVEFAQEEEDVSESDDVSESKASADIDESDELIEKIARRVVEMMSEKVVKEVAWEVVPQMSDLIIKEIAREKMKD
ncbi:MAG: response regulator [Pyrinomonadaceae bacterium]|nr:response regulator [Pyrinomonadaceae bacterium]